MTDSPTEAAAHLVERVHHAHGLLKRAWAIVRDHPPTLGSSNRTGPVSGGERSDPTASAAATVEAARSRIADRARTLCTEAATLATAVDGHNRNQLNGYTVDARLVDVIAVHRQHIEQYAASLRRIDEDPTGYDEASELLLPLRAHVNDVEAHARRAYATLAEPPADADTMCCDDPGCQRVVTTDDLTVGVNPHRRPGTYLCRLHADRERRRLEAEAARAALEAARPWCAADHRPCNRRISEADAARGRRNCAACRMWRSRKLEPEHVGTSGAFKWHDTA